MSDKEEIKKGNQVAAIQEKAGEAAHKSNLTVIEHKSDSAECSPEIPKSVPEVKPEERPHSTTQPIKGEASHV